jgi:hypothetical protein
MTIVIPPGRTNLYKHVCMGLGIKSKRSSRKLLKVTNWFGHVISYHTVEARDTDLVAYIFDRRCVTPDCILEVDGICTGLALDKYTYMNSKLLCSGTRHDTVGMLPKQKRAGHANRNWRYHIIF